MNLSSSDELDELALRLRDVDDFLKVMVGEEIVTGVVELFDCMWCRVKDFSSIRSEYV